MITTEQKQELVKQFNTWREGALKYKDDFVAQFAANAEHALVWSATVFDAVATIKHCEEQLRIIEDANFNMETYRQFLFYQLGSFPSNGSLESKNMMDNAKYRVLLRTVMVIEQRFFTK